MDINYVNMEELREIADDKLDIRVFLSHFFIILFLSLIIVLMFYCKKNMYYESNLLVTNDNEVMLKSNFEKVEKIINREEIIINDKTISYQVKKVMVDSDYNYLVYLDINLGQLNIINALLPGKILLKEENLINYFIRVIKGG